MSIKSFVNNEEYYSSFLEFLDKKIEEIRTTLETAQNTDNMFRLQGQLYVLRRLKKMKEEVNGPN